MADLTHRLIAYVLLNPGGKRVELRLDHKYGIDVRISFSELLIASESRSHSSAVRVPGIPDPFADNGWTS